MCLTTARISGASKCDRRLVTPLGAPERPVPARMPRGEDTGAAGGGLPGGPPVAHRFGTTQGHRESVAGDQCLCCGDGAAGREGNLLLLSEEGCAPWLKPGQPLP